MRMNTGLLFVFALSAILLTSCSESDPLMGPPNNLQASGSVAPIQAGGPVEVTLPFRGQYNTTFSPPSTPPPFLEFYIQGEGLATSLGVSIWEGPSTVDLTQFPPTQTSTAVFTSADGSQFTMLATGVTGPGPDAVYDVGFQGTFTLHDGTGRFAGLSGGGTYSGVASNSLAIGKINYDGTISVPRSHAPSGD